MFPAVQGEHTVDGMAAFISESVKRFEDLLLCIAGHLITIPLTWILLVLWLFTQLFIIMKITFFDFLIYQQNISPFPSCSACDFAWVAPQNVQNDPWGP